MSDLARSLIDAAAEQFDHGEQWKDVYVDPELRDPFIRACVVAVLETLAAESGPLTLLTYERRSLRRLAAEIRGGDV